jgi:hypothetical protein
MGSWTYTILREGLNRLESSLCGNRGSITSRLDVVNDNLQSLGREWYRAEFMRRYSKATKKEKKKHE